MIRSFLDKDSERAWNQQHVPRFDPATARAALRKLLILDAAETLDDLRVPPGNRPEKPRSAQASIRINQQWRICFRWTNSAAERVEIVDYH